MILIVAALLGTEATWLASRLALRTAIVELLPSDDPGVVALNHTAKRMGGDIALLLLGIHSPDRAANLRYADAVTQRMAALPKNVSDIATYHVREVKALIEKNKWLYLSESDLQTVRDRLMREISRRKNPLLVDLGDDDEPAADLQKRIGNSGDQLGARFTDGVFSTPDGRFVWVVALAPGGIFGENAGEALLHAEQKIVGDLDPKTFHPEMVVHYAGSVPISIATRQAIERDILWVTITCVVLVCLSIGLYFRRVRAVPLIGLPAALGTVMAFAVAELTFGYLNSSTAFLASIILGNGINYGIILMSRYQEQRARGDELQDALALALGTVLRGTVVAAICASSAYATLMLTSFRGFLQFGVMAAAGVLFCWSATFTVLPALLVVFDSRSKVGASRPAPLSLAFLGRALEHRRTTSGLVVGSFILCVASVGGLAYFMDAPFEYDFRKLSTRFDTTPMAEKFGEHQDKLFGRWPNPDIVLADDGSEVESIRAAIRAQDLALPGEDIIGSIVTIWDVLPGTPAVQQRKLALLAELHKLAHDPSIEALDEKDRKRVLALDPPTGLRVLLPMDLPPIARRPFTEIDGHMDRVLLVYPTEEGISVWNGEDLLRLASVTQHIRLEKEHKTIETSGNAVVFGAMLRSILHDGPLATLASLGIVVVLCLLIMRPMAAATRTIGALVVGVLWMIGAAGAAEVKITFLNFIALPITFGIAVEYALNVMARFQESGNMVKAVMSTGGAVALCSWTTIIGYGSLLAARNHTLQGFGAMAILGEISCLLAALVALPSFVQWRRRRSATAP